MPAKKTKTFKRKEVSLPLLVGIIGVITFLTLHSLGIFTSANSSIKDEDKVTVDGVANTTQYLTSMVLHMSGERPGDATVVLSYDPELNALRVKGALNADGLIVGNNSAIKGNSILGGSHNQIVGNGDNGLIIGGTSNAMRDSIDSIIVGGEGNKVLKSDSVALIGASNTTFPADANQGQPKEQVFVVGGDNNTIKGSQILVLGAGENSVGSHSILMGSKIQAGDVDRVFVWSDADQPFIPKKASAFYVNTQHGIGLNTNDPKVQLDIGGKGGQGALKLTQK